MKKQILTGLLLALGAQSIIVANNSQETQVSSGFTTRLSGVFSGLVAAIGFNRMFGSATPKPGSINPNRLITPNSSSRYNEEGLPRVYGRWADGSQLVESIKEKDVIRSNSQIRYTEEGRPVVFGKWADLLVKPTLVESVNEATRSNHQIRYNEDGRPVVFGQK